MPCWARPGPFFVLNMLNNCPAGPPESALGPNFNATASGVSLWGQGGQEGGPTKRRPSPSVIARKALFANSGLANDTSQPEAVLYHAAQPRLWLTEGRAGSSTTNCIFAVHVDGMWTDGRWRCAVVTPEMPECQPAAAAGRTGRRTGSPLVNKRRDPSGQAGEE